MKETLSSAVKADLTDSHKLALSGASSVISDVRNKYHSQKSQSKTLKSHLDSSILKLSTLQQKHIDLLACDSNNTELLSVEDENAIQSRVLKKVSKYK